MRKYVLHVCLHYALSKMYSNCILLSNRQSVSGYDLLASSNYYNYYACNEITAKTDTHEFQLSEVDKVYSVHMKIVHRIKTKLYTTLSTANMCTSLLPYVCRSAHVWTMFRGTCITMYTRYTQCTAY